MHSISTLVSTLTLEIVCIAFLPTKVPRLDCWTDNGLVAIATRLFINHMFCSVICSLWPLYYSRHIWLFTPCWPFFCEPLARSDCEMFSREDRGNAVIRPLCNALVCLQHKNDFLRLVSREIMVFYRFVMISQMRYGDDLSQRILCIQWWHSAFCWLDFTNWL